MQAVGSKPVVMETDWDFPGYVTERWRKRQMVEALLRRSVPAPKYQVLKQVRPKDRWVSYFLYLPDGVLTAAHLFTLQRLRDESDRGLLLVCAAPGPTRVPSGVANYCDALVWKELHGFDFSAYAIALWQMAKHSPGAQVVMLNDSVLGPFSELKPLVSRAHWDLTGFTGSREQCPHIQSYAFIFRRVTALSLVRLSTVFLPMRSFNSFDDVVQYQELRFANVAARQMSVGAFWAGTSAGENITLTEPVELLKAGFPFVKKSLLTKHKRFQQEGEIKEKLLALGHPVDC